MTSDLAGSAEDADTYSIADKDGYPEGKAKDLVKRAAAGQEIVRMRDSLVGECRGYGGIGEAGRVSMRVLTLR